MKRLELREERKKRIIIRRIRNREKHYVPKLHFGNIMKAKNNTLALQSNSKEDH